MRYKLLLAAVLVTLMMSVPAMAQQRSASRDDVVAADVSRIIGNHVFYTIFDFVKVDVSNGTVTLTGVVTEPYKKIAFNKAIQHSLGNEIKIDNKLEVLPPSTFDNQIRSYIAQSIYSDTRLLRYSMSRWPYPIHIIVKNGHVRLEGEVGTMMDKRLIQYKVRSVFGVVSLDDNLEISRS